MSNSTIPASTSVPPDPISSTPVVEDTPSSTVVVTAEPSTTVVITPSAQEPSTTRVVTLEPSTTQVFTETEVAPTRDPTTRVITDVTTIQSVTDAGGNTVPTTIVVTRTNQQAPGPTQNQQTSSSAAALAGSGGSGSGGSGGLSTAGITAIAVVIPVAVVALLVGLGIFFWRKRKSKKEAEEQRRKEVEDYSYNPNGDPTLPAVGSDAGGAQMTEDHSSGYRGWGAATMSNRKQSTTLSGGHTQQLSDSGSNTYGNPSSPGHYSDGHSSDPIMNNRDTMSSDDLGALGVGPAAAAAQPGIRRGPSNASSAYSAGGHSEHSDDAPPLPSHPMGQPIDYNNPAQGYGYGQHGPYGDGSYGGAQDNGMPVVRDVSARRNTRIQPGGAYQQGNSGIAQNF
ncbi:hypothetical protein LTR37_007948 [Vermiconidia calcicola]|uniref:Uncharacterized protein n=1 Tax=Vermiconidia calcicola TaxID=1690605 RepID=A0ACC3NDE9_9PEZI|nr:hypothetical protein LTR37_007948 [Vermiconidia calcicola]